jgi:ferredoxin-nitrite reductase
MKEIIHMAGIEAMAKASGEAESFEAWDKEVDDVDETDQRPKWAGLFHRRKGHYGRYMMRLKIPNGVVTSEQTRYLAKVVRSCGEVGLLQVELSC